MLIAKIIDTWIAPLLVTIIGGIIVFLITQNKNYNYQKEKQKYLYALLDSIDNNFQICIDIYIYNQHKLDENLNKLDDIIVDIYNLSTKYPPLINIDSDRYVVTKIMQSARNLNSTLAETKNTFSQADKIKTKIKLLNKLRNTLLLYCYNNKSIINNILSNTSSLQKNSK